MEEYLQLNKELDKISNEIKRIERDLINAWSDVRDIQSTLSLLESINLTNEQR